jgi:hypothetical protein
MEKKMNDDELVIAILIVIGLVIFSTFTIGFNTYKCRTKAVMQELEWSYGPIQGCMVKQENGKWIDYDRLRYMDE